MPVTQWARTDSKVRQKHESLKATAGNKYPDISRHMEGTCSVPTVTRLDVTLSSNEWSIAYGEHYLSNTHPCHQQTWTDSPNLKRTQVLGVFPAALYSLG